MRTVPSAAGPVDAGPTVLTMKPVFDDLFAAAGHQHRGAPEPCAAARPGAPLVARRQHASTFMPTPTASAEAIRAFAGPKAEAQFRRFSATAAALFHAFDAPVMQRPKPDPAGIGRALLRSPAIAPWLLPGVTLSRALARSFTDPRLRQLFGRYATYVGGSPARIPAVLALIWEAEARGVWAVEGGMARLAATLETLAVQGGATILHNAAGTRIVETRGRVTGVTLADGRTLPCAHVVHAGDPAALTEGLLGAVRPRRAAQGRASAQPLGLGLGLCRAPAGLPLAYHNVMFAADPALEFAQIARGEMPGDPTLYICAQDRAAGHPPGPNASRSS